MDNSPDLERRKSRARKWAGRAPAGWAAGEVEFGISSWVRAQKDRVTRAAAGATCRAVKKVDQMDPRESLDPCGRRALKMNCMLRRSRGAEGSMPHCGIDLPTTKAKRSDKVFANFGGAKLSHRPEVNVRVTSYTRKPSVERRLVYISCCDRLQAF